MGTNLWESWTVGHMETLPGVLAGRGPASNCHPGVYGRGGLPHQLPEEYMLQCGPIPEGTHHQVPSFSPGLWLLATPLTVGLGCLCWFLVLRLAQGYLSHPKEALGQGFPGEVTLVCPWGLWGG